MKRAYLWAFVGLLYGSFVSWYTNFDGPLAEHEIRKFLKQAQANGSSVQSLEALEQFMRTDNGDDFVMINLLDLNKSPPVLPDTGANAEAMQLLDHYMEHMYPAQFKRASHPVFYGQAVGQAMDVVGIEGADQWGRGALFRYRSRRDIVAIATNPAFSERHDYKIAALTKSVAVPVEPIINLGDARIVVALVLFSIGSLLDMLIFRRRHSVLR